MLPIPSFLVGPLCGALGMGLALAGAWGWLVLIHDPGVRAAQTAEIAAAVAAEKDRQHQAATAALEAQAAAYAAQQTALAQTRRRITSAPSSIACVASPPVRAALDSLRQPRSASAGAPGGATVPPDMRAGARAP